MKKIILALAVSGFISCALMSQQAQAVTINGTIGFFGSASASGASGPPTTVSFTNPWTGFGGTGDYFGTGTPLTTFSSFNFTGDGAAAVLSAPATPLWTFTIGLTTYSFDLLTLTNGHTDAGSMSFSGTGVAHITGFEDTIATFGLSGSGGVFNFFATSTTTAAGTGVPDGGSAIALLGIACAGVEILRRKLRAA